MKITKYWTLIAIFGALTACNNNKNDVGQVTPPPPDSDTSGTKMVAWITRSDESVLLQRQPAVPFANFSDTIKSITVDTTKIYQTMDGFGYTLTGGSAYVIQQLPTASKAQLLQELFGNDENSIRISFLRISIGASDLDASVFTYNDLPAGQTDPALDHFTLDPDRANLIPLLKEIIAINPAIKILGSPWTPPVWMKDNDSSIGGSLKDEYFDAYSKYLVKYIQGMKEEGINIYAVTPQNEPLNPANNPSLLMLAGKQAEFIKNNLGPAFQSAGITTKIFIYDHNCDRPDYPLSILNDPAAKAFIDGSAFHLYAGDISALSQVHDAFPDKNVYFTEQYTAIESTFAGDLQWHIKNLVIGAPRNWSRTVLEWNLANDQNYGPHTPGGCTTCKGALTINGSNVKRNVAYYIIAHASKFVPQGSVRISSAQDATLQNVAYRTPDNKIVVIVLNTGAERISFLIKIGDKSGKGILDTGAAGSYVIG
jgi:glucosylceramidase